MLGNPLVLRRAHGGFAVAFYLLVFVLLPVSVTALAQNSEEAASHAQNGIAFAKARDWPEAERELAAAVAAAPQVAVYRAQLGSILGLQGKWKDALASFEKAVELQPENLAFRRETAAVEWQLGSLDAADKNLQFILQKQPGDPGATLLSGLVEDARGNYEKAAKLFSAQFQLAVAEPDRAIAFFRSTLHGGQRTDLDKIIEVLAEHREDKGWTGALSACTQLAISVSDLIVAEKLFQLVGDDNPNSAKFELAIAKLQFQNGQPWKAEPLLRHLAERNPNDAEIQVLLGNCYESQKKFDLAARAYQHAIELDPQRIASYANLASLLLDLGKTTEAIALSNRATSAAPENAQAWVLKGYVQLHTYAYQDATESYTRAAKLDRSNAEAVLGLASAESLAGSAAAAIARYKNGIALFPADARFYVNCAEIMMASPDALQYRAEAASLLKKAVQLDPQSFQAHYQLGQLALQEGRLVDAENEFLASLKWNPDQSAAHFALSLVYRRTGRLSQAGEQFNLYKTLKQSEDKEPSAIANSVDNKP